ncbi:MAG: 3-isopropylmalate dehydratase small subunit [Patescibacteria group bacterium]
MNHPKLTKIISTAVPLPVENIDTDQIIPARFLKATTREGFGENLFRDWRYKPDSSPKEDFVLNQDRYSGEILVAGKNFGCGSSREHAAWAIKDYGFKAVISSFYADIFKSNALNNGLLPIIVTQEMLDFLLNQISENPQTQIVIDLENQTVQAGKYQERFEISPYKKLCILNGYDDVDYLYNNRGHIEEFEQARPNDWSHHIR